MLGARRERSVLEDRDSPAGEAQSPAAAHCAFRIWNGRQFRGADSCGVKAEGLELTHIFNRGVARKRVDWAPRTWCGARMRMRYWLRTWT